MKVSVLKAKAEEMLGSYKQKDPASYAAAQQAVGGVLILDGLVGIENPFNEKKRPGIFGSLMGLIFGVGFMFIPTFFGNIAGTNVMTATTTGEVVALSQNTSSEGSPTCTATARYVVDGREYTNRSVMASSGDCGLTEGQSITVNYNPEQPGAWASDVKSLNMILQLFFWAGLVVALTSFVTFIIRAVSIVLGWKLLRSGRALAATLPGGANISGLVAQLREQFIALLQGGAPAGISQFTQSPATVTPSPAPQVQPVAVVAPVPATPPAPTGTQESSSPTPTASVPEAGEPKKPQ